MVGLGTHMHNVSTLHWGCVQSAVRHRWSDQPYLISHITTWDTCGLKSGAACTSTKLIFFLKLEHAAFNQVRSVVRNLRYVYWKREAHYAVKNRQKNLNFSIGFCVWTVWCSPGRWLLSLPLFLNTLLFILHTQIEMQSKSVMRCDMYNNLRSYQDDFQEYRSKPFHNTLVQAI